MRLSDDKISHLSHLVYAGLKSKGFITPVGPESNIRKSIRQAIEETLRMEDAIDEKIRLKLQSYSRMIIEGTSEWTVLYDKFLLEEMEKKGLRMG